MEQNHYNDDFEKMLRESTEDFRMYPSRKIWHSIYNDLHPDRKWPSFAVCLVLLTAILHIGVSNNNNISKNSSNLLSSIIDGDIKDAVEKSDTENAKNNLTIAYTKKNQSDPTSAPRNKKNNSFSNNSNVITATEVLKNQFPESNDIISQRIYSEEGLNNPILSKSKTLMEFGKLSFKPSLLNSKNNGPSKDFSVEEITLKEVKTLIENKKANDESALNLPAVEGSKVTSTIDEIIIAGDSPVENNFENKFAVSTEDKSWIDNYSFYNKKNKEKLKAKFSVQYYITPSVGYRALYKNNDYEPNSGILAQAANDESDLTQQAAANLEGGVTLLLKMNKRLRFKTGLQLNLTNYVTYAHKLEHPTQTTVLLNSDNNFVRPVAYSTNYGNVPGSNLDRLNNKTAQISVPIGADYKLSGKDRLKWYIGATIQPTRIINGATYLISSDEKNFATDPSMIRRWNVNSSIETFISYKMPSGLNINIGPQFRYQLMSTYNKQYTYSEKLYNIGLKIGLSSNF